MSEFKCLQLLRSPDAQRLDLRLLNNLLDKLDYVIDCLVVSEYPVS
jgi:hypothetical protein